MSIEKLDSNIYAITDASTRGNVSAIILPSQIIVMDTGMHLPYIQQFRSQLEKKANLPISTVFITHSHGDHVFGNQIFKDCNIITSELTYNELLHQRETQWTPENIEEWKQSTEDPAALKGLEIVMPNRVYKDFFRLIDGAVTLYAKRTGGHTEGSSYIYCPSYKVAVLGDNLFNKSFPWGGSESANPIKWRQALQEYLTLDVDYYIPGHGPIATRDDVEEFLLYLNGVLDTIKTMVQQGEEEDEILNKVNEIEYYEPKRAEWKQKSLERWYEVIKQQIQ